MMEVRFEKMCAERCADVLRIFNYYIENSTAAFAVEPHDEAYFSRFLSQAEFYPAYSLITPEGKMVGFCRLKPHSDNSTFAKTAHVTYFIDPDYTGQGIGRQCLEKLEQDALKMGITNLLAEISSENSGSVEFHGKHGFSYCGELKGIGYKQGRSFGIVFMQKRIQ